MNGSPVLQDVGGGGERGRWGRGAGEWGGGVGVGGRRRANACRNCAVAKVLQV